GVRRAARPELERAVSFNVRVAHDLKRILAVHLGRTLDEINRPFRRHLNVRVSRYVDRVVATDFVRLARGFYRALARKTYQPGLQLARRERGARLARVETDSTVDEVLHLAVLRRDCDVAALAPVRAAKNPAVGGLLHLRAHNSPLPLIVLVLVEPQKVFEQIIIAVDERHINGPRA